MGVNMSSQPEALPYLVIRPNMTREEIQQGINALLDLRPEEKKPRPAAAVGEEGKLPRGEDEKRLTTEEICSIIAADSHFAQDAGQRLYVFQDGVYKPRGAEFVRRRVKEICSTFNAPWTRHKSEECVEYLRVNAPLLWERPPLNELNLRNGILNVETRELRPHDPSFLSPVQLPVKFDPTATCPHWDRFVEDVFPADAHEVAYELVSWLMTPDMNMQKAALLLGSGSNGKSIFISALTAFLGRENVSAIPLHRLESDRFSVARLVGKLANIFADLPVLTLESTSTFKALTGGDLMLAERKFQESFEFQPYARCVFSANGFPRSADASPAFFRRWAVIPFERNFEDSPERKDPSALLGMLTDPVELSGVLNRALDMLPLIRKRGLTESPSMKQALDECRAGTDPLSVWLDRFTVLVPDAVTPQGRLYEAYVKHCADKGLSPITRQAFGRSLKKLRPGVSEARRTVNGAFVMCYLGIALSTQEDGE
jgi:putative DNA primase/helicase